MIPVAPFVVIMRRSFGALLLSTLAGYCHGIYDEGMNGMEHAVSARVVMKLPREAAWDKLRDLSQAHNYVPGVTKTVLTTEQTEGVGASRRVHQGKTRWLDETVTDWDPGYGFSIRLHQADKGPIWPFEEAAFRYHLEDAGNGQTALTTTMSFTMRHGGFGRFLAKYLLAGFFRGMVRDVAVGMKDYYETGQPVTPARRKLLKTASI